MLSQGPILWRLGLGRLRLSEEFPRAVLGGSIKRHAELLVCLGLRRLVLVALVHLVGLLSRVLGILLGSPVEASGAPRLLHVLSRELVLLVNDPLAFLLLVLNHGLLVYLLQMLLELKELLLEPRVRKDDGPPLSSVGECVKHGQTQLPHQIGDDHRGAARNSSVTITRFGEKLITSGPKSSRLNVWHP
jgi:hypothetical protein